MPKLLEELKSQRSEILKIAAKYGVSNVRVFGSVARGEEKKNSDIDLLVSIKKHKGMGLDVIRFQREVAEKMHKKVDVISDNGIYPLLKKIIIEEALPL